MSADVPIDRGFAAACHVTVSRATAGRTGTAAAFSAAAIPMKPRGAVDLAGAAVTVFASTVPGGAAPATAASCDARPPARAGGRRRGARRTFRRHQTS